MHASLGPRRPPLTPPVRFPTANRMFPSITRELKALATIPGSSVLKPLPAPFRAQFAVSWIHVSNLPSSQSRSLNMMCRLMSADLVQLGRLRNMHVKKHSSFSEFQRLSQTPRSNLGKVETTSFPTLSLGGLYSRCGFATNLSYLRCQQGSSATPPVR